ncbi:hypothetical protein QK908_05220 [Lactococcus cremoris]
MGRHEKEMAKLSIREATKHL